MTELARLAHEGVEGGVGEAGVAVVAGEAGVAVVAGEAGVAGAGVAGAGVAGEAVERRPGRPRSEDADRAIEAAALELLVEDGFDGMSIERVAAKAGVGKATIYRRWVDKSDLIVDAVTHRCAEHIVEPDTGSLREDMRALLQASVEKYRRDGDVLRAFGVARVAHAELSEVFRARFLAERREATQAVLKRAVARGELPASADLELLADVGPALLWHRLSITGAPIDHALADRILDTFFAGG